jgi:hypothetical protein
MLMASGKLNVAHLVLRFDVLCSIKPQGSTEKQNQPFRICKWNSCSMLLKVFGTISYWIIGAPYALVLF